MIDARLGPCGIVASVGVGPPGERQAMRAASVPRPHSLTVLALGDGLVGRHDDPGCVRTKRSTTFAGRDLEGRRTAGSSVPLP